MKITNCELRLVPECATKPRYLIIPLKKAACLFCAAEYIFTVEKKEDLNEGKRLQVITYPEKDHYHYCIYHYKRFLHSDYFCDKASLLNCKEKGKGIYENKNKEEGASCSFKNQREGEEKAEE